MRPEGPETFDQVNGAPAVSCIWPVTHLSSLVGIPGRGIDGKCPSMEPGRQSYSTQIKDTH
jgi:hypothetical protein